MLPVKSLNFRLTSSLAVHFVYAAGFALRIENLSGMVFSVSLLPVIVSGLFFGVKGGIVSSLCISVYHICALYLIGGYPFPEIMNLTATKIGMVSALVSGILTGLIVDYNKKIHTQYSAQLELSRKLQETKRQLIQTEKLAAIGQLAAGIAHEINNPLGYITSNLHVMTKYINNLEDVFRHCASVAGENSSRIVHIISDSRELLSENLEGASRIRKIVAALKDFAHPAAEIRESADASVLVEKSLTLVTNNLKNICSVKCSFDPVPSFPCDSQKIIQVFVNILINAGQSFSEAKEKNTIEITISERGGLMKVTFKDNGCGISAENLKKVCEPFFTTKPVGEGTGLGMYVVYQIVEQHRGKISIDSVEGLGTTVSLEFPCL